MKHFLPAILAVLLSFNAGAASLITESEARLPAAVETKTRSITRGPGIRVISPDPEKAIKSPFNLKVAFEPRGGAKIVPESIKVTYLKAPAVDLLDRVKPGISEQGIDLANAEAPPGEHRIQMSLEDSEGRRTSTVIRLSVVK
ncbi:MAG: hypothetical protein NTW45_11770 [Rhodocyclales bacterium]|nr:hypothetical protein [Rhodocyclales bacterium]